MTVTERYNAIIAVQNYSHGECHDISKWLCGIRDFAEDDPAIVERMEAMLQAFITRKKLGTPVTTKAIEQEFLGEWLKRND